jgi:hypothetical protein
MSAAHPSCQSYGIDTTRRRRSDRSGAGIRALQYFTSQFTKQFATVYVRRLRPEDAADTCPSTRNGLTLRCQFAFHHAKAPTRVELFV